MLRIVKNTMPQHVAIRRQLMHGQAVKAVRLGMELVRRETAGAGVSDFPVVTGRLKGSISGGGEIKKDQVFTLTDKPGVKKIIGYIGTNVKYAKRVEFGFVGSDSKGRRYNQKGRFYFTKGWERATEGGKLKNVILNTLQIK